MVKKTTKEAPERHQNLSEYEKEKKNVMVLKNTKTLAEIKN